MKNKYIIGKTIEVNGWVNKNRRMGELIFIDLRNIDGIIQIVVEKDNKFYDIANTLRSEDVVSIKGKIVERKNKNKNIPTGNIEIIAEKIRVVSKAKQTPLIIDDVTDALEPVRMEYRYLDLRRMPNQQALIFRSNLYKLIRNYFYKLDFKEIETPVITKPTPGGANELRVLSSNHKGKEYALVQSPQIYKQLLMYSGIDKYFQIAKCFRDEDSRADRQLEFTQLDIEKNFTSEKEIQNIIEKLVKKMWNDLLGIKIEYKFKHISYDDAINNYGSDKPDLRIKETIRDITNLLENSNIDFINNLLSKGNKAKIITFDESVSSSFVKKEEEIAKSEKVNGLSWLRVENNVIVGGSLKKLDEMVVKKISELLKKETYTLFLIIDENQLALEVIGRLRNRVASKLNLIDENSFEFAWVVDWPLFELNAEGKIDSVHNPFTNISLKDLKKFESIESDKEVKKLLKLKARGYDLVLNGSEIGGGSIRINNRKTQEKVFELIGISKSEIKENFGWFLDAQEFGIPEHGGIALGIDRILSIMLKTSTIRDVIAFPKSTKGTDEMTKSPIKIKK